MPDRSGSSALLGEHKSSHSRPDGSRIVGMFDDRTAIVCDALTGKCQSGPFPHDSYAPL